MEQRERWNDPEEALQTAMDGRQASMWTTMPGIVLKREGNNVSVQVAIQGQVQNKTSGEVTNQNLPPLINVPLVMPGGGGFGVTLPVAIGDEVLVHFASRCIDSWWQDGGVQPPMETRMHDLSDGFATPAPMSNKKALSNISSTALQIRSTDGSCFIEVAPGGKVNITSSGDVTITGNLKVTGNITAGSAGGSSVELLNHTHTNVTVGVGTSGPPTPGS